MADDHTDLDDNSDAESFVSAHETHDAKTSSAELEPHNDDAFADAPIDMRFPPEEEAVSTLNSL